jgi:hypothetical protein
MPIIARLFDGTQLRFPDDTPQEVIDRVAKEQTLERQPQKEATIGSQFMGGLKGLASSGKTAAETAFTSPEEAAKAAEAGRLRSEQIGRETGAVRGFKEVGEAYDRSGLLGAAGEFASQIPGAVSAQLPQIGAMAGGARLGAMAGTAFGPAGTVIGGALGAGLTMLPSFFAGNVEEQAQVAKDAGTPLELDRGTAALAAVGQAATEGAGTAFILGRNLVGKIIGKPITDATKAAARKELVETANASLLKGAGKGAVRGTSEIPVEVAQEIITIAQAGGDVLSDEAIDRYGQSAYGALQAGSGLGAAASPFNRTAAREQLQAQGLDIKGQEIQTPAANEERERQLRAEQESAELMLERDRAQANVLGKTANAEGQFELNLKDGKRAPLPKTSLQGTPVPARQAGFDAFGRPVKEPQDVAKPSTAVDQTPITQTFDAQFDLKQLDEESARLDSQKIKSPTTPEERALNKQINERQKQIKVLQSNIDELKLTPYKGETTKAVVPDTVLTPKALADIGLSKGAGYTNSLKNLDMSLPEDRTKAANVIGSAINNPRLSDEVKSNLQGLYDSKVSQGTVEGQGQLDFQPIEEYSAQTSTVTPELLDTLGIGKTSALRKNASLYETDLSTPDGRKFFTTVLEAYSDTPKRNPAIQQRIGTYLEGLSAQDIEQDVVGDLNVTEPTTEGLAPEPAPATEPALERQAIEPSLELDTVGDATTTTQTEPTEGVGQTELTGLADVTGEPTRDTTGSEQQLDTLTEQTQDNPLASVPPAKIDAVDAAQLKKAPKPKRAPKKAPAPVAETTTPIETVISSGVGKSRTPFENFDQTYAQEGSKDFRVNSDLVDTADYADWLGSLTPEQKNIIAPSFTNADNPFLIAGSSEIAETKAKFEKLLATTPAPVAETPKPTKGKKAKPVAYTYDKALDALDDILLEDSKPKVRALAKKFYEADLIRDRDYDEILRVASDRDMGADDVGSEIRVSLENSKASEGRDIYTNEDDPVATLSNSVTRLRAQGVFAGNVSTGLTDAIDSGDTTGALNEIINNDQAQFAPLEKLVAKAMANLSGFKPTVRTVDTLGEDSKGNIILGMYDPVSDTIQLVNGTADSQTFLHEMTHAFTHRLIQMQERDGITIPAMRDLSEVFDHIKQVRPELLTEYNADTLTEFAAQVMSAPDLQYELMGIPYKKVSLFVQFARAVGKLLGLDASSKEHNALLASIVSVDGLMGRGRALQQLARGQKLDDIEVAYTTQMAQSIDTPIGQLTPTLLSDVAQAPTQATRTAKHKFLATYMSSEASVAERVRQQTVDALAPIARKLNDAFEQGVRGVFGDVNPMIFLRQANDHAKVASSMFENGTIIRRADGLWEASTLRDADGNKASAQAIITRIADLGKKLGMDFIETKAKLSTVFEAMRLDDLRTYNQNIETQAKALASSGDVDGAYELRKGKFPLHMTYAEIDKLKAVHDNSDDIKAIHDMMNTVRGGMIDAMVTGGRLNSKQAASWKAAVNYIPYERLQEVFENPDAIMSKGRTGLASLRKLPEFSGSYTREVTNTIDSYMNKLAWMVDQSMRNSALVSALDVMETTGYAKRLGNAKAATNKNLVLQPVYIDGKPVIYEMDNEFDYIAFSQAPEINSTTVKAWASASRLLRTTVTATPPFALKQVIDDAQRAMFNSGVEKPLEVLGRTLYNFPRAWYALAFKKDLAGLNELSRSGIVGEFDFNPVNPVELLELDTGAVKRSFVRALIHRLEQVTKASDVAARLAVYEQTIKETGNVTLAETRARELINFNRRGASNTMRTLTQVVPFFNSYAQGTDLMYRGFVGTDAPSGKSKAAARAQFIKRIGYMTALGTVYAMAMSDDDEYANLSNEVRDRNWIMPKFIRDSTGIEKLPVPVELGFLFKSIPERTVQYLRDSERGEGPSAMEAVGETLVAAGLTYGMTPTPTLLKPILENLTNYSLFTRRELVPSSMKDMPSGLQYTSSTSELAKSIGGYTNVSPIKIENALRGYFGLMGASVLMATDPLINPNRPARALNTLPFLSIALLPPTGTRTTDLFYDFREDVVKAVNGANSLKNDPAKYEAFVEKNQHLIAAGPYVNNKLKILSNIRAQRKLIENYTGDDMSRDEKRTLIDELDALRTEALEDVKAIRSEVMKMHRQ